MHSKYMFTEISGKLYYSAYVAELYLGIVAEWTMYIMPLELGGSGSFGSGFDIKHICKIAT